MPFLGKVRAISVNVHIGGIMVDLKRTVNKKMDTGRDKRSVWQSQTTQDFARKLRWTRDLTPDVSKHFERPDGT